MTSHQTLPSIDISFSFVAPMFDEEDRFAESAKGLADFILTFGSGSQLILVDDSSSRVRLGGRGRRWWQRYPDRGERPRRTSGSSF